MAFLAKFAASKYVGDKLEDHFGPEVFSPRATWANKVNMTSSINNTTPRIPDTTS